MKYKVFGIVTLGLLTLGCISIIFIVANIESERIQSTVRCFQGYQYYIIPGKNPCVLGIRLNHLGGTINCQTDTTILRSRENQFCIGRK